MSDFALVLEVKQGSQLYGSKNSYAESKYVNKSFSVGFGNKRPGDDVRGMEMEMRRRHVEI